uniref:ARAD1C19118p n=1 Tax=Blastobotrys adeninivorans TaxID=409370 RepID=A0A060T6E6_BLAAD
MTVPMYFCSHGSTMMLGEQSLASDDWAKFGREAEKHNIKGVVMMGAHWGVAGENLVHVSVKEKPGMSPIAWVHPDKYQNYEINCSPELGHRVVEILREGGINAQPNDNDDWIHDSLIPIKWMFPKKCPPITLISCNVKYEGPFHMRIGSLLSGLRDEGYLLIGSGGAVHNLYRNYWPQVTSYRNNFAQALPPERWALQFRQCFYDALITNPQEYGITIREGVLRLMHSPLYREAHGTDDHYMAACFCAGAAKSTDKAHYRCEVWELQNMDNAQFQIGDWDEPIKA